MWQTASTSEAARMVDVRISCQFQMAAREMVRQTANQSAVAPFTPSEPAIKDNSHRTEVSSCSLSDRVPKEGFEQYGDNSFPGYERLSPDTRFSSRQDCSQTFNTNGFSSGDNWSAFSPPEGSGCRQVIRPTPQMSRRQSGFPDSYSCIFNDSGYSSPGQTDGQRSVFSPASGNCPEKSVLDISYSGHPLYPCSSGLTRTTNSSFVPSFGFTSDTFNDSLNFSGGSSGDRNSSHCAYRQDSIRSSSGKDSSYIRHAGPQVTSNDSTRIALKERDVNHQIHNLRSQGCKAVMDVEEYYRSQTAVIDNERHTILCQMAFDSRSADSINQHYNQKLLMILQQVEQRLVAMDTHGRGSKRGKVALIKGRLLPKAAVKMLETWYQENLNNPYPSRETTLVMAAEGGITVEQIRKWFANKRNRSRPKPESSA